jgi:hypothetical protein
MKIRRFPSSGGTYMRWSETNCNVNKLFKRITYFTPEFAEGTSMHVMFYNSKKVIDKNYSPTIGEFKVTLL